MFAEKSRLKTKSNAKLRLPKLTGVYVFGINKENLKNSHQTGWLITDILMLGLLFINLALIIFDSMYETVFIRQAILVVIPNLEQVYQPVHENFLLIDLGFISIFLTEFFVRWFFAVKNKDFLRWYFFPFIHWYDLVGCIPLGSTRIFRFLRVFSIFYRLHKYKIIDLNQYRIIQVVKFYYQALVEELSDRIIVKVLSDLQSELKGGTPILDEISNKILASRKQVLVRWTSTVLNHAGKSIESELEQENLRNHIERSVAKAIHNNSNISSLNLVPILGGKVEELLQEMVSDIVIQTVINLLKDIDSDLVQQAFDHGLTAATQEELMLTDEIFEVIDDCLELIKSHVEQQKWKEAL